MSTGRRRHSSELRRETERVLKEGPRTAQQLMEALGISQATFSRTIRELSDSVTMFRVSGDRTPRYALLRALPQDLHPRQRVYRCLSAGNIAPFAELEFLAGGGTLERSENNRTRCYEGLPPYLSFAAPSGFLGRQLAQEAARSSPFPASLKDWNDDHRIAYLFRQGLNLPGNLIFGDLCLQREIDLRQVPPTEAGEKLSAYIGMAQQLKSASYGSSAGGEQPKFLWFGRDTGHVIVKFARAGSRMAELLPLEHLALRALAAVGVPTARTALIRSEDFVFLEVRRFDRIGDSGRVGLLSAGAIDDEFFGRRDSWPEFAARCVSAGYLSPQDARHVGVMAAFSELIGNTDRHFENISVLIGEDGDFQGIAPAYDILPMRYASIGGGLDPELLPIEPKVGTIGAAPDLWQSAARAADEFWRQVAQPEPDLPVTPAWRELARKNRQVAQDFAATFLPV